MCKWFIHFDYDYGQWRFHLFDSRNICPAKTTLTQYMWTCVRMHTRQFARDARTIHGKRQSWRNGIMPLIYAFLADCGKFELILYSYTYFVHAGLLMINITISNLDMLDVHPYKNLPDMIADMRGDNEIAYRVTSMSIV